jgi:uncharacterized membrane protein YozB (DUF420 family)
VSKGFLGTAASLAADRTLVIESAMGIALIVGTVFARRRQYRAHAWCQSTVVLLNLGVIAQFMVPSFRRQVAPEIPASLGEVHYVIATIHGLLGTVAELLALYVVLAAGTKILPKRLRFVRYKRWMRLALALWWIELLLGLAMYLQWYGLPRRVAASHSRMISTGGAMRISCSFSATTYGVFVRIITRRFGAYRWARVTPHTTPRKSPSLGGFPRRRPRRWSAGIWKR